MGIPIYAHYSLVIILLYMAWSFGNNFKEMAGLVDIPAQQLMFSPYFWGTLLAVALFVSITLHELGHSYVALRQKINIRGITLMLFGGVALLERMPRKAGDEAKIAIAGPLVSIFLGGIFIWLGGFQINAYDFPNLAMSFFYLGVINLSLAGFNLLPAFPMDGGRILRSLLAMKLSFAQATRIASNVGKVMAVLLGIYGLINGQMMSVIIALFIYSSAHQENKFVHSNQKIFAFHLAQPISHVISKGTRLEEVVKTAKQTNQVGFPVVENGHILGLVLQETLQQLSPRDLKIKDVSQVMNTRIGAVDPNTDISLVLQQMVEMGVPVLFVAEENQIRGLINQADVEEALNS